MEHKTQAEVAEFTTYNAAHLMMHNI